MPSTSSAGAHGAAEGALRPHLGIEVNPNHGLYAFFRRKEQDGKVSYETVEPTDVVSDKSGASASLYFHPIAHTFGGVL